jgi:hypothetical protein
MAASKLNLTRDQLASFLQDHEQVRQFERLFSNARQLEPTTLVDLAIAAGTADQKATEALDAVATLAQDAALQAEAKAQQALDAVEQMRTALELLATAPPPREFKRSRYGSFYSTATQTATTINTATGVTLNTTDLSSGVSLSGSPQTRINVDTDGIYNLQLSVQFDKTSGGTAELYIWFRKNGADVTDSASQIRIQGNNAEIFSALNYFFSLKAGDYVEIMFSVTDLSAQLLAVPAAAPHPGIPSIIVTVSNNIQGFQ